MSVQDKIAAAQGILQKSDGNPWTPQEMAAMSQGLVLQQLLDAMAAFRGSAPEPARRRPGDRQRVQGHP